MSESLLLRAPVQPFRTEVFLPSSKSESNRALILAALSRGSVKIENLSEAKDTQVLSQVLSQLPDEIDIGDAGTAMRFLTAFLAFQQNRDYVLTGSTRMQERPIGLLVDALRRMGADIAYMDREGFPPLMIFGRNARFGDSSIEIPGHVSSQYISALLLIAPTLTDGLEITITGKVSSRPYIDLTLALLEACGVHCERRDNVLRIPRQSFRPTTLRIAPDWSAASYWYSIVGLAPLGTEVLLHGLGGVPRQGDSRIRDLMLPLGVATADHPEGLLLSRQSPAEAPPSTLDFTDCPDLAQTVIVYCAAQGIPRTFTGLESLRIKETDRIAALDTELRKLGVSLAETADGWSLRGVFTPAQVAVDTYGDHRMAMAFAPLVFKTGGLTIRHREVVAKSYPKFWQDLERAGMV
jgi:3-phosphoshikimate 1-carboxyvinyltransferase